LPAPSIYIGSAEILGHTKWWNRYASEVRIELH
jgi:hypothetical protein